MIFAQSTFNFSNCLTVLVLDSKTSCFFCWSHSWADLDVLPWASPFIINIIGNTWRFFSQYWLVILKCSRYPKAWCSHHYVFKPNMHFKWSRLNFCFNPSIMHSFTSRSGYRFKFQELNWFRYLWVWIGYQDLIQSFPIQYRFVSVLLKHLVFFLAVTLFIYL